MSTAKVSMDEGEGRRTEDGDGEAGWFLQKETEGTELRGRWRFAREGGGQRTEGALSADRKSKGLKVGRAEG